MPRFDFFPSENRGVRGMAASFHRTFTKTKLLFSMKIHLMLAVFTAILLAAATTSLFAASSAAKLPSHSVSTVQTTCGQASFKHFKKEKNKGWLRNWWKNKAVKFFQKAKIFVQRISLGFVGFIVTLVGAMFIVLGLVIPAVGIVFLVIGIIIAFVGLLLWVLLSKIGVRVSTSDGRDRQAN